jgi:hypothetical protein
LIGDSIKKRRHPDDAHAGDLTLSGFAGSWLTSTYRSEQDMPDEFGQSEQDAEVYFIREAAYLFGTLIRTIKGLESHDDYLAEAMASVGYEVQARFSSLLCVVEQLKCTRNAAHASTLIDRAKTLISDLGQQLDRLAALAERQVVTIVPLEEGAPADVLH